MLCGLDLTLQLSSSMKILRLTCSGLVVCIRMINVLLSGSGNSKLWRESVILHDQSIKNLHLEVAWLKSTDPVDDSGNANNL